MKRTVEPELMLAEDQARAYALADFENVHRTYPALFDQKFSQRLQKARVLDLGCGPCDVTIRFAKANAGYVFHAVDGSGAMLRYGAKAIQQAKLENRIELIEGVIPGAPIPDNEYDVILSTSFLHHLHDPQVLWRAVRQYAKPGTIVFITDLLRPNSREIAHEMIQRYAANEPRLLREDFYNSLLAAFTPEEVEQQLLQAGLQELEIEMASDRHLLIFGLIGEQK